MKDNTLYLIAGLIIGYLAGPAIISSINSIAVMLIVAAVVVAIIKIMVTIVKHWIAEIKRAYLFIRDAIRMIQARRV